MQAYESLQRLLRDAATVRDMFLCAGLDLPPPLLRMLDENPAAGKSEPGLGGGAVESGGGLQLAGRPAPQGAEPDWIWVPVSDATTTTLMLAIMRSIGERVPSGVIVDAMRRYRSSLNPGSVFNAAARYAGTLIDRNKQGWVLRSPSSAPLLVGDIVWGPSRVFQQQEVAAFRRSSIAELLRHNSTGLMTMQIVKKLHDILDARIPVAKDIVEEDLLAMRQNEAVYRVGNSRLWKLAKGNSADE